MTRGDFLFWVFCALGALATIGVFVMIGFALIKALVG
jgi:hypothetical protein